MTKSSLLSVAIIIASLAGCSSAPSKRTASDEEIKQRAYEDAEDSERLFPKETTHRIYDAQVAAKKAGRPSHELVLAALCDKSRSTTTLHYSFTYHPQQHTGDAIDQAALLKRKAIQQAVNFYRSLFFWVSAGNGSPSSRDFEKSYNEQYIPQSETLRDLLENYTFILPSKITQMLWKDSGFFHNGRDYLGPQAETPYDAIRDRELLWKIVLADGSTLETTPLDSGELKISATLNLDLVCRAAVPLSQLQAR